ncbi:MAG: secretin N-terminal domain-containing protein [Planctomycetaceae bacterium]
MIEQLESDEELISHSRTSKVYQSDKINPNNMVRVIRDLFQNNRAVSVTENVETNSVVVYAKPAEHARIAEVMQALEEGTEIDSTVVYRLDYADARTAQQALQQIAPKARIGLDTNNHSLAVNATPADQARIKETLEELDVDPNAGKKLEVFSLQLNEAYAAELAVERFFGNSIWGDDPSSPLIDSDASSQQLLVRGTDKQLADIREFLIKMGESHLAQSKENSNSKIRVIPFSGNTQKAVEELERVWPQLRKNKINVVVPSAVAPTMRKFRQLNDEKPEGDANFSVEDEIEEEKSTDDTGAQVEPTAQDQPTAEELKEEEEFQKLVEKAKARLKAQLEAEEGTPPGESVAEPVEQIKTEEAPTEETKPIEQPTPEVAAPEADEDSGAQPVANAEGASPPPVIIAPGDGSITISSDDPEALNQIENLLRAMSRNDSKESIGKDFVIFQLKYASAESVENTLQDLFNGNRRGGGGGRTARGLGGVSPFSSMTIQADDRLNAIIVYGNKKERDMVEELLQVLDTEDTTEVLEQNKPRIVTVQHTPAIRIESVLRDIYSSELRSAGGSRPIPVPTGVSLEVAATIQQINITMAGPLLHLTVDEDTNSIIVSGAEKLVNQVEALIHELDQKAETESTQTFKVVPLKKINSGRARQVLQELFPQNNFGGSGRGRRFRRGPN